jgi:predicted transposase/invertase (TIGR01784 family)
MDVAIRTTAERMDMIRRDPGLAHAYDLYEEERIAHLMWAQGERREGRQEGRWEEKMAIAKALKASGDDANKIALVTGLSLDEIAKL